MARVQWEAWREGPVFKERGLVEQMVSGFLNKEVRAANTVIALTLWALVSSFAQW